MPIPKDKVAHMTWKKNKQNIKTLTTVFQQPTIAIQTKVTPDIQLEYALSFSAYVNSE
jgi:hypothetical protein